MSSKKKTPLLAGLMPSLLLGGRTIARWSSRGNRLTLEALDLNGRVFDRFEVTKRADGTRSWRGLPEKSVYLPWPNDSSGMPGKEATGR